MGSQHPIPVRATHSVMKNTVAIIAFTGLLMAAMASASESAKESQESAGYEMDNLSFEGDETLKEAEVEYEEKAEERVGGTVGCNKKLVCEKDIIGGKSCFWIRECSYTG